MPRAHETTLGEPRRPALWATIIYALATLSLAYPALGGSFLVNPSSDQYIAGYAFREFAAAALKAGQGFPQWNPYLFGGMPYVAAMHGDIFYPTFLLRMMLPTDQAMTWSFAVHLFLAGVFTYGFLRAWGLGFFASLIGGLAYMLSGPIAAYASPGHDGKLYVSALLPLALWMTLRGMRDGRAWAWGGLAITVGLAVLSPHPQLLQYLLLTTGAFALFLAFGHEGAPLPRNVALKRLGFALGAVVLGGLIGAVQYLPVREYVSWSPRAGGKGYDHAVSYSLPTEELFNALVPQFSGILDKYWGRNGIHLHSEYPGVVVLLLAGAGMFTAAWKRFRWFWMGVFAVSLLWALGGSTPFYRIIYAVVPGTKFFRAPSTMMYVTMFSLAVFAALGTERVLTSAQTLTKKFYIGWAMAIVAFGVMLAGGLTSVVAQNVGNAIAAAYPGYDASTSVFRAQDNQPEVILGALRSIAFVLLALALLWFGAVGKLSRTVTAYALGALVALDLWTIEHRYWMFSPPAKMIYASDPAIDFIKSQKDVGRVLTLELRDFPAAPRDPAFHDALMTHRIRLVAGYHGNELGRYQTLEAAGNGPVNPTFWRHENVHYLYSTLSDSLMPQLAAQLNWPGVPTKLLGPVKNTGGSTIYLYRLPGENPAAWVAGVRVKGNDDQALGTVMDARFDPTRAAIFDSAANVQTQTLASAPQPSGVKANVTTFQPGKIDVQLDKPAIAGSALVVSENFFPGWSARVDGNSATVARANYNLIGVALPAGAQRIELRFADPAYGSGKTLTIVALLMAIVATIAGFILVRRRRVMVAA